MISGMFFEILKRIETAFKPYRPDQREDLFADYGHLSEDSWRAIVETLRRSCTRQPSPADYENVKRDLVRSGVVHLNDQEVVECDKCNGEGYRRYIRRAKVEWRLDAPIARCSCANGERWAFPKDYVVERAENFVDWVAHGVTPSQAIAEHMEALHGAEPVESIPF